MRREPTLTALATILTILIAIPIEAFDNEPTGFRGLEWGTEVATVASQFSLVESGEEFNTYSRKDEKLAIGSARLSRIGYVFWKGKLSNILIETKGIGNQTAAIKAFQTQFGSPNKPNQFLERYFWLGATTYISIDCSPVTDDCTVVLSSVSLSKQRQAEEQQAAERAGKDF